MDPSAFTYSMYVFVILSLFVIDYVLGNGFLDIFKRILCGIACAIRKMFLEESKSRLHETEQPFSFSVLFVEMLVLYVTLLLLNTYKKYRGRDHLDQLLQESKEALRQTNEFLEKWKCRRIPTGYSYLDEEPQEIQPLKLEVPILHMAIVDTRNKYRNLPESGDARESINITDSALLSVTDLLDDDLDSGPPSLLELAKSVDSDSNEDLFSNGLWDVTEGNVL